MNKPEENVNSELRKLAEERIGKNNRSLENMTDEKCKRVLHELEVHQLELEMQNEELRKIQVELGKSQQKYSDLYNFAPVGYFTFDKYGTILEANLTGAKLLNIPRLELIKKPFACYLSKKDADTFYLHRQKVFKSETRQNCDLQIKQKGKRNKDKLFFAHMESIPVEKKQIRTIIYDKTLIMQAEQEKAKLEKQLMRSQKLESIGTLAGGIAHDFNNILTGIFGNIELAKLKLTQRHEIYPYLEHAAQSLKRATHLTKQLLTFAKGGDPILETLNLRQVVQNTVRFNLSGSNVNVHFKLPRNLWQIKADKEQFCQVIANLTINAREAMPDGGSLHIATENISKINVKTAPHLDGDFIKISIWDEGIGIQENHIEKIFDPYFSTKQMGGGLGLATVHSIISKHNGHIMVDSTPGKGTTFTLYLPAEANAIQPEPAADKPKPDLRFPPKAHILLMDDEEVVRKVSSEMLNVFGYTTESATDGKEAVEKYITASQKGSPYDAVIMDLTIPGGMGGKEAVQEILNFDPQAKVIVSSGYSTDPVLAHFNAYGFKGRLTKPFHLKDLKQELTRVMQAE